MSIQTQRKLQIGVMGSAADLKYSDKLRELAEQVGRELAKQNANLVFGAEKDYDSLSTSAGRGARAAGGLTVGITYGKDLNTFESADIIIATGLERGGGREFSLVLSCDAIITISGGSGTLNEMVVAYQAGIPIIALRNTGGWSDKMADQYFDDRKRAKVIGADTPEEAVALAISHATGQSTRVEHEHL
jgi:uncharacterized protein (TIGR00725 family)